MNNYLLTALFAVPSLLSAIPPLNAAEKNATLKIQINDPQGAPLPCRVHLSNSKGELVEIEGLPFWRDHFVCPGRAETTLPPDTYHFVIERGPEYGRLMGNIQLSAGANETLQAGILRIANLRKSGWYSGDLHVHRPYQDVPLLMQAEDLDFAPVITWWNTRNPWNDMEIPQPLIRKLPDNRITTIMAGEDEREGGALLYFGLRSPLDISTKDREFPSPMKFVNEARTAADVWIDIEKPFWWDVPTWLASGNMNSIGIANNHMCRSQMYPDEAWGRPRDTERLPAPHGNGYWTQEIYYHALNCGLRIPPSAGSASGVLPNPVGYNRVYVHLDEPFTRDAWFRALASGRSFMTNGPLLLVTANQTDPGNTIQVPAGKEKTVHVDIRLTSQDTIAKLELIQNGKVTQTIACSKATKQQISHQFTVDHPGWFLIRAIADVDETFRFASTAPWFIEVEGKIPHISRTSAQFFLDWVNERIDRVTKNVEDPQNRAEVLIWHHQAKTFWQQKIDSANAE